LVLIVLEFYILVSDFIFFVFRFLDVEKEKKVAKNIKKRKNARIVLFRLLKKIDLNLIGFIFSRVQSRH
jgi:hypothetical protein